MRIYKIHDRLWRVSNNGFTKDVFVEGKKIIEPENVYNVLTEEELKQVELILKKK